jgi:hypothetical protein
MRGRNGDGVKRAPDPIAEENSGAITKRQKAPSDRLRQLVEILGGRREGERGLEQVRGPRGVLSHDHGAPTS